MKTIDHKLDTLPKLTDERRRSLQTLATQPDDSIDTTDIPELTGGERSAVRGTFYRPVKHQITARPDADILAWLKPYTPGYQTRLSTILRRVMQR